MFPITVVPPLPSSRKDRYGHGRRLLFLLICLSCWTITRLSSSHDSILNRSELQSFKEDGPSFPSSWASSNCLGDLNSTNCKNTSITNIISQDHEIVIVANITATRKRHRHHHPNFTFDFPLCLVHVGKTAGSSISCGLGLMYADCEGMPREPPLPHVDYFHMRKNNCLNNNDKNKEIATLLMTIRNPLTRIQSWFNFEKDIIPRRRNKQAEERLRWKRGMLFTECYDNLVDFVTKGLEPMSPLRSTTGNNIDKYEISTERPINMSCRERAWAAILGVREFSYHEWYNYEHYWTALQNIYQTASGVSKDSSSSSAFSPSLLVLRTEHLLEDWSKLSKEDLFRQVNKGSRSTTDIIPTSNISAVTSTVTKSGDEAFGSDYSSHFWLNLCHAMCPEIQIYKQILQHADNMDASHVQESIREVQVMCPQYNSNESSCSGIPQFPSIKVTRRQYLTESKKRLFVIKTPKK